MAWLLGVAVLAGDELDPLAPAPRNDGLNSGYEYLFARDVYRPGRELWCEQRGRELVCSHAAGARATRAH
jgi:hypothetical protein